VTRGRILFALAGAFLAVGGSVRAANDPLRVAVVTTSAAKSDAATLATGLKASVGIDVEAGDGLAAAQRAKAVVFVHGPGADVDAPSLRRLVESGVGIVVIGARADAWPREFPLAEWLGAKPGDAFAGGAPMSVINLFGHPILTGIERLETRQAVTSYEKLADDAQMIIEGTVGEATTPLAWVWKRGPRRLCHVVLGAPELFADANYQRLIANAARWVAAQPIPGARPIVQRTFMAEAHPGSFAITLPEGPGICLDPVRGGINYVWDGDFVDMRPRWLTKHGESPRIFGEVFYQEKGWQPLRAGGADAAEDFQFRGYALRDGWPEFHYRVGGRDVYESFRATEDGGLARHFRVERGATPLWVQLEPQTASEVNVRGLERDGNVARFSNPEGGEFTIEIRRKTLRLP
jgi:hypothetical protein